MKNIKSNIWLIPLTVITALGLSMSIIYFLEMMDNGFSFIKLSWAIVILMISLHPLHILLLTGFNETWNEYNWVKLHLLSIAIPDIILTLLLAGYPLDETFPGKTSWSYIASYGVLIALQLVCIGKGVYYVRNTKSRASK